MESTFSALSTVTATTMARTCGGPSLPLLTISKALNRHLSGARHLHPLLLARCSPAVRRLGGFHGSRLTSSNSALRSLGAAVLPVIRRRLQCLSSSSPSFRSISSGGGGGAGFGGYNGGSGGGGGGGSESGDSKSKLGAAASDGVSLPSSDIIILDVGGMTCGGCSASVKKILESQPQVASASVNLTTETAIVWPVPEAKSVPDWQKSLGETLANHLTNCGFQSTPRGEVPEDIAGEFAP
ncbi:PREDICTED: copper-transporting ATPase PAA1, chloroplastic-like isoform X1 [Camelina sativa]|uniref:Copper-transporting ATPase PAA1, chloroplastic-like isoform X1 n=1 Tax=Camelina sativa TaxID=90675 RepID=A0ABM0UW53_CAMSA|nr:PREDICTED: copper-transporting ATPase PAA1, chloroplastic-like isoform X1 [Camelina sativa]